MNQVKESIDVHASINTFVGGYAVLMSFLQRREVRADDIRGEPLAGPLSAHCAG